MPTTTLQTRFRRELEKLKHEIQSYHDERNLWKMEKNIPHSSGNLWLHLVGNLNL